MYNVQRFELSKSIIELTVLSATYLKNYYIRNKYIEVKVWRKIRTEEDIKNEERESIDEKELEEYLNKD